MTDRRDRLTEIQSGTHAVVDLDRYEQNLARIAEIAGSERSVMAVVKANAYGHGAPECARAAIAAGCRYLGVARIDEALQLRRAGIAAPILVIGPPNAAEIGLAIANNIALTVATETSADLVLSESAKSGRQATIHVKVDTGLHRYGAIPELAVRIAEQIEASATTNLEGLYTHFSSADEEDVAPTMDQIERFQRTVHLLQDKSINPPLIHLANSAAIIAGIFPNTTMVRAGIASYGLDPSEEVPAPEGFSQILSLKTVITRRFTLESGESVSYNRKYTATGSEPAAAVPIGYADGIERHLSNSGWLVHADGKCPIIGRVCMDQTVISVPESAQEGDPVTVIGSANEGAMTVATVGELCGTNTYEPVTRIAARVPRLYLRSGAPASWSLPLLGESGAF